MKRENDLNKEFDQCARMQNASNIERNQECDVHVHVCDY